MNLTAKRICAAALTAACGVTLVSLGAAPAHAVFDAPNTESPDPVCVGGGYTEENPAQMGDVGSFGTFEKNNHAWVICTINGWVPIDEPSPSAADKQASSP